MKTLVVGFGSIGSRHAHILKDLNFEVTVITKQNIDIFKSFDSIQDAFESEKFDYVVIANKTCEHYQTLNSLKEYAYQGKVLVEKPLFDKTQSEQELSFLECYVGYNLRFHPLIMKLHDLLHNETIVSCQTYVGQYLPQWRPQSDYRKSYSAHKNEGGGVLLDLSHELDYLSFIFGSWKRLTALGGHLSKLEIDSEDVVSILMETEKCPILCLEMNYLDRVAKRQIIVNTNEKNIHVDLIKGTINVNGKVESFEIERNYTYIKQHLALITGEIDYLCNLKCAQDTMKQIEAINTSFSHSKGLWVYK
jgi:predicted dehydrogenase